MAEDNPAERRLIEEALADCNPAISPIFVSSGPDVLTVRANEGEYTRTQRRKLLILDLGLPTMDGFTVLRKIRGSDD